MYFFCFLLFDFDFFVKFASLFFFFWNFFLSAVQAICGDWEGCACELREGLRQARCYRRCHRPEQGIALFLFLNFFFLLVGHVLRL